MKTAPSRTDARQGHVNGNDGSVRAVTPRPSGRERVARRRRFDRIRRAASTLGTARRRRLRRVLRELRVVGGRPATVEGAREFRRGLEELGTTYVKLGQLLSSRPDLIPDEYIDELSRLVDEVPPEPYSAIEEIIEREIGTAVFRSIDPSPLAAASIAQVHEAVLEDGREVVIKVRRPGIVEEVDRDLDLLKTAADML